MNNKKSKLSLFLPYFVIFIFILFFANLFVGWPINSVLVFGGYKIKKIDFSKDFAIEDIYTNFGRRIGQSDRFSYKIQTPLKAQGTTSVADSTYIWTVLKDIRGGYYLQNPPAETKNGYWYSRNIRPQHDIREIIWVKVNKKGNEVFIQKVRNSMWGEFGALPDSTIELSVVVLQSIL
ncbi:hypothetical protein KC799_06180 [candidate division KSB1 bacterium]|nr:hypothetical protein [candidate division KSB1 bacterium]